MQTYRIVFRRQKLIPRTVRVVAPSFFRCWAPRRRGTLCIAFLSGQPPKGPLFSLGGTTIALIENSFSLRQKGSLMGPPRGEMIDNWFQITYVLSVGYMVQFRGYLVPQRKSLAFRLPVH